MSRPTTLGKFPVPDWEFLQLRGEPHLPTMKA